MRNSVSCFRFRRALERVGLGAVLLLSLPPAQAEDVSLYRHIALPARTPVGSLLLGLVGLVAAVVPCPAKRM